MNNELTTGKAPSVQVPPFPYEEFLPSIKRQLELTPPEVALFEKCLVSGVPPIVRTEVLALLLGISHKLLYAIAMDPEKYYRSFLLAKRSGGKRRIDAPRVYLKAIQRWILRNVLYAARKLPAFVTGFVPGRNIVLSARMHSGKKYLLKVDIKDFFGSVSVEDVRRVFGEMGYPEKVCRLLTHICTLRGRLPQGAPTSPYLANLAFSSCDNDLKNYCELEELTYTRYADDLTFSRNKPISPDVASHVDAIISGVGFRLNASKSKLWHPGQRMITTGMVVNEKAHPPRTLRRRLRAIFHQASREPKRFEKESNRLIGWAAFVNMYDPDLGQEYLSVARNAKKKAKSNRGPSTLSNNQNPS